MSVVKNFKTVIFTVGYHFPVNTSKQKIIFGIENSQVFFKQ